MFYRVSHEVPKVECRHVLLGQLEGLRISHSRVLQFFVEDRGCLCELFCALWSIQEFAELFEQPRYFFCDDVHDFLDFLRVWHFFVVVHSFITSIYFLQTPVRVVILYSQTEQLCPLFDHLGGQGVHDTGSMLLFLDDMFFLKVQEFLSDDPS